MFIKKISNSKIQFFKSVRVKFLPFKTVFQFYSSFIGMAQTSMSGNDMMNTSTIHTNLSRLPEQARNELVPFETRISFANNLEASGDGLSYVLACALRKFIFIIFEILQTVNF